MKPVEWKTYRTRFLVKAKQLSSSLSFVDSLGRHHCGRKGDYLVESSDGVVSIAPRQIFEDIYVAMGSDGQRPRKRESAFERAQTAAALRRQAHLWSSHGIDVGLREVGSRIAGFAPSVMQSTKTFLGTGQNSGGSGRLTLLCHHQYLEDESPYDESCQLCSAGFPEDVQAGGTRS